MPDRRRASRRQSPPFFLETKSESRLFVDVLFRSEAIKQLLQRALLLFGRGDRYRGFDFLGRAVKIAGRGFEPSLRQVTKNIVWRFRGYAFENLHRFGIAFCD